MAGRADKLDLGHRAMPTQITDLPIEIADLPPHLALLREMSTEWQSLRDISTRANVCQNYALRFLTRCLDKRAVEVVKKGQHRHAPAYFRLTKIGVAYAENPETCNIFAKNKLAKSPLHTRTADAKLKNIFTEVGRGV